MCKNRNCELAFNPTAVSPSPSLIKIISGIYNHYMLSSPLPTQLKKIVVSGRLSPQSRSHNAARYFGE